LNPAGTIREAEKPFKLALVVRDESDLHGINVCLLGDRHSQTEASSMDEVLQIYREPLDDLQSAAIKKADFVLATEGALSGVPIIAERLFLLDTLDPGESMKAVLESEAGKELRLAIGRRFPALRQEVARKIVRDISMENAVFVIATALGDYIPSWLLPLIGIAEAASDTAFLTANQVRMLFNLGAVYDVGVGYAAQWKEISSIVGAAFGWRALARELVSKIPFGGGIIPKGAIAYAGTVAAGEGLIFFYTTGRHMTRSEMSQTFKKTYSRGLDVVRSLVGKSRPDASE
jgi:uncharacterized protein (DUF697 family)